MTYLHFALPKELFLKNQDLYFIRPSSLPAVLQEKCEFLTINSLRISCNLLAFHFYTLDMEMRLHKPFQRSKRGYKDEIIILTIFKETYP